MQTKAHKEGLTSVHRAEFLETLVPLLPSTVKCHFGHRLSHYTTTTSSTGNQEMKLNFVDGQTATCDILIGFDGIKSAVRTQLYRDSTSSEEKEVPEPRWTGTYVYRGIVPFEELEKAIGYHCAFVPQMYLGQDSVGFTIFCTVKLY